MFWYVFNQEGKAIAKCDSQPDLDDIGSRQEIVVQSDKNLLLGRVVLNGVHIEDRGYSPSLEVTGEWVLSETIADKEVEDWFKNVGNIEKIIGLKVDATNVTLRYVRGILTEAFLIGGRNILDCLSSVEFPRKLNTLSLVVGAVVCLKKDNSGYLRKRACDMLLRSPSKSLQLVAYTIVEDTLKTEEARLDFLAKSGFQIVPYKVIRTYEQAKEFYESWKGEENSDYESEGVVIKINKDSGRKKDLPWKFSWKWEENVK